MKITLTSCMLVGLLCSCGGEGDASGSTDAPISGPTQCEKEAERVSGTIDEYTQGISKTAGDITVSIVEANPAPPAMGDNTWTLEVTDASGAPVTGATVQVLPIMAIHGHKGGKDSVVMEQQEAAGLYEAEFVNFNMDGFWAITVKVTAGDTTTEVKFGFCI